MTIAQQHQEFKVRYDKLDALLLPNILPTEIDLLLNQAQDRFVKQRYGTTNTKKESFEETQKRADDLKAITRNVVLAPLSYATDNIDTNARFINLPTDYWFIIQERAEITYDGCDDVTVTELVEVRPIEHNEFSKVIKDPFKKPNTNKVLRLMENNRVELIASPTTTINNYRLRYIKEPIRVSLTSSVNCELSSHTHTEIVDIAVAIALEYVESRRTPGFNNILNTNE